MSDSHDKPMQSIVLPPARGMSPVVSTGLEILRQNPNPEALRELLAIQRDYEAGEAKKAYAAALIELKADLPKVLNRDKHVSFNSTNYTHTTLGAAVEAVTPHLITHGFAHSWHPSTPSPSEVSVTCRLTHRAGHFEEVTITGPPDAKGGKNGAQAVASTITMLQRYSLLALLGIATADMEEPGDDGSVDDDDRVDSARNLAAVGKLRKLGKTAAEAQELVGRDVADWTVADLKKIEAWARSGKQHANGSGQ